MSNLQNVLKLSPDERKSWLNEHLPNRVGAAWVWLPDMKGEWEWKGHTDFAENADRNQVWCICRAVDNGRKAAMRWLIEFVGVCFDEEKESRVAPNAKAPTFRSSPSWMMVPTFRSLLTGTFFTTF